MTGPEHYTEAERILTEAREQGLNALSGELAAAQVHATLALAAATAYPAIRDYLGDESTSGRLWTRVTA